jgi:hypothetical protein
MHTILEIGCAVALVGLLISALYPRDSFENKTARAWLRDKARREKKEMRK